METRTREINADTDRLHQRLRDIAQAVLNDEDDYYIEEDFGRTSPRRLSPIRGGGGTDRFDSPERAYTRYVQSLHRKRMNDRIFFVHGYSLKKKKKTSKLFCSSSS